ncbi:hypothetical protein M2651_11445 [Clostridium sp. SYSU_GA19001]|uniref:hypothetical protein n=1 Tax=Clostridium caldaquaticum TaxID=2940653 RepID=UPI00207709B1|nr:hypothetical protein [Clostridium caldaquaticum]MCM8711629.1 hypothetical protein [Clostridium caldaquaticum]
MKTLTVVEGIMEEKLKTYLKDALNVLGISHRFVAAESLKENMYLDYILLNSSKKFENITLKGKYCFVNMDSNFSDNLNVFGNTITYGFGIKNTVTVSSVEDNNLGFVYCLQRYLNLDTINQIEPQEIPIRLQFSDDIHLYALMIAITIGLIQCIDSETIERNLVKKFYN